MKTKILSVTGLLLLVILSSSCIKKKIDSDPNLKQPVDENTEARAVSDLMDVIEQVKESPFYYIFHEDTEAGLKAGEADEKPYGELKIDLDQVSGIYSWSDEIAGEMNTLPFFRFFEKTGESEMLVLQLPEKLAGMPVMFYRDYRLEDLKENNFEIKTSLYHKEYTDRFNFQYRNESRLFTDGEQIGEFKLASGATSPVNHYFSGLFDFGNGISISLEKIKGDSCSGEFILSVDGEVLFSESWQFLREAGMCHSELTYYICLGDIRIEKDSDISVPEVWINGTKRNDVEVVFTGKRDMISLFTGRDIMLCYEDGRQSLLSELMGRVLDDLKDLENLILESRAAKHLTDYAAMAVWYRNHSE